MSTVAQVIRHKAELVAGYLVKRPRPGTRPLVVSMQGPQGSGKSTICARLVDVLREKGVVAAAASLDDFYLPHAGLTALAAANPSNAMLAGRGPPGTHDVDLLVDTLSQVHSPRGGEVVLPVFDKAAHGGRGDRAGYTVPVPAGLDVFVLEGWSLGYGPLPDTEARARWAVGRTARTHPYSSMAQVNTLLGAFEGQVGRFFDCHVAIRPMTFDYVYTWRLEQEHMMKEKNGGKGMSDEDVRRFVDRYMPVYEVFGEVRPHRPTFSLLFGPEREIVATEEEG